MKTDHLNIFKNFYKIFGLGKKTIHNMYLFAGVNIKNSPICVKKIHKKKIYKQLKKKILGPLLEKYIKNRIKFFFDIRSWKGVRHAKNYPIRGQRTHTNAKTKIKLC